MDRDKKHKQKPDDIKPDEKKRAKDHPLDEDPAVQRGDRIGVGKEIDRGGKEKGDVPGATERR